MVGMLAWLSPPPRLLFLCGGIKGWFCWPSLFISGVLLSVFGLFPVWVHLNALVRASLQAPLRMEMKAVCNEFHSARVRDPTAISRLIEERIRETRRGQRDGGQRWREEEAHGKTLLFYIFYTPLFSAWLPSCYNVKLAFLSLHREQWGTSHGAGQKTWIIFPQGGMGWLKRQERER